MNKKTGRNDPCPCGSGKKFKKCCLQNLPSSAPVSWMDKDGLHYLTPGKPFSTGELEEMTREYQNRIRNSPVWDEMVKEFSQEKAEELLKQCRAKPG